MFFWSQNTIFLLCSHWTVAMLEHKLVGLVEQFDSSNFYFFFLKFDTYSTDTVCKTAKLLGCKQTNTSCQTARELNWIHLQTMDFYSFWLPNSLRWYWLAWSFSRRYFTMVLKLKSYGWEVCFQPLSYAICLSCFSITCL